MKAPLRASLAGTVMLATGDSSRETLASSIDVGAAGFLLKPCTRESLMATLEKASSLHAPRA